MTNIKLGEKFIRIKYNRGWVFFFQFQHFRMLDAIVVLCLVEMFPNLGIVFLTKKCYHIFSYVLTLFIYIVAFYFEYSEILNPIIMIHGANQK